MLWSLGQSWKYALLHSENPDSSNLNPIKIRIIVISLNSNLCLSPFQWSLPCGAINLLSEPRTALSNAGLVFLDLFVLLQTNIIPANQVIFSRYFQLCQKMWLNPKQFFVTNQVKLDWNKCCSLLHKKICKNGKWLCSYVSKEDRFSLMK